VKEIKEMEQGTRTTRPEKGRQLERAVLDGLELEYEVHGAGEPIMLLHAGVCAEWFKPLLKEPALAGGYRVVRYHRVGYAGSGLAGPVSIAQQAAHCRLMMRHLRIRRAHVVGHSSSGNIALHG
jgi:pimeloyl-ACP methyl ester carboxylesterase